MKHLDKLHHFVYSGWIVFVANSFLDLRIAVVVAILFGLGKEFYDSGQEGNKWDWEDIYADIIGIVLIIALLLG